MEEFQNRVFSLQWHLTAKCQQKCLHCYMRDEPSYDSEVRKELGIRKCLSIVREFKRFTEVMEVQGRINFSGGDPLLKEGFWDILDETKKQGLKIGIIGNPNLITHDIAGRLRDVGVESYQISIDGTRKTHDLMRNSVGHFDASLKALEILNGRGIETCVMLTLNKRNMSEVAEVMDVVAEHAVFSFSFARVSAVGSGKRFRNDQIRACEYRDFLLSIEDKINQLRRKNVRTKYGRKCHLWKLLEYEKGHINIPDDKEMIYDGCTIGVTGLIVLADGTVYACRRFPSPIGHLNRQRILDIFLYSSKLNMYRNHTLLEKCSKCELVQICRGCPAVAYGVYGDWRKPDPQCWKVVE